MQIGGWAMGGLAGGQADGQVGADGRMGRLPHGRVSKRTGGTGGRTGGQASRRADGREKATGRPTRQIAAWGGRDASQTSGKQ